MRNLHAFKVFEDFEHGLDSILTDFIDIPELDESFEEVDAMPSSVSSGFLCSVGTIYGPRLGLYFYLYHMQIKCKALR